MPKATGFHTEVRCTDPCLLADLLANPMFNCKADDPSKSGTVDIYFGVLEDRIEVKKRTRAFVDYGDPQPSFGFEMLEVDPVEVKALVCAKGAAVVWEKENKEEGVLVLVIDAWGTCFHTTHSLPPVEQEQAA